MYYSSTVPVKYHKHFERAALDLSKLVNNTYLNPVKLSAQTFNELCGADPKMYHELFSQAERLPEQWIDKLWVLVTADNDSWSPQRGKTSSLTDICALNMAQVDEAKRFNGDSRFLPMVSVIKIRLLGFPNTDQKHLVYMIALHELVHALGYGLFWNMNDLQEFSKSNNFVQNPIESRSGGPRDISFPKSNRPLFNGKYAIAAWREMGGDDKPELEHRADFISPDIHWSTRLVPDDVMVSHFRPRLNYYVTNLTASSLKDLGYTVDFSQVSQTRPKSCTGRCKKSQDQAVEIFRCSTRLKAYWELDQMRREAHARSRFHIYRSIHYRSEQRDVDLDRYKKRSSFTKLKAAWDEFWGNDIELSPEKLKFKVLPYLRRIG